MKKTLFFGYNKRAVDKAISDMQEKIQLAESRSAVLQEKYEQAERIILEKESALERYTTELNNYTYMYNQAANKTEHYEKSLTNIGQIYMYAYDSASSIVKTAQKQAGCFMEDISAQADYANEQANIALDDMRRMEIDLQDMVAVINQKTMELQKQISGLLTQAQTIPSSFTRITKYQDDMNEQINCQIQSFLQQSKEFLNQNDAIPQNQDISPTFPEQDLSQVAKQEDAASFIIEELELDWYQDLLQTEAPQPVILEEQSIHNQEQTDEQDTQKTEPNWNYPEDPEDPEDQIIESQEQGEVEISSPSGLDSQESPVSIDPIEQTTDRNQQEVFANNSTNMGQKKADRVRGILNKYSQLK